MCLIKQIAAFIVTKIIVNPPPSPLGPGFTIWKHWAFSDYSKQLESLMALVKFSSSGCNPEQSNGNLKFQKKKAN